ncbi:uncharacterized protein PV09_04888 [Verruconis gallopava]|uniref:Transcription initiation factor TFIID subunit 8 n=1 Tax=Verruconis gallopava TaxID=253628 RepID=A0A0D1XNC1_9PEZI|nr:uncharacterized protein PV09_04888 [Verruconis gallopava]KIW04071.1 hypothetical protein PV09_04888 [Verruconis gallopava]
MPVVHHATTIRQDLGVECLSGAQDESFFDAQLLRSITLALSAVGFDSVKPAALEAFRARVEEYMLHFLQIVRGSMQSSRRTQPIPQDFIRALADLNIYPHQLLEHIKLKLPPHITQPPIASAAHDDPSVEHLEGVLGGQLADTGSRKKWMPAHLPDLPSKHTYQHTPIFTTRENDPRRIRERATEEGVLAERAMRKLLINGGHGTPKIPFARKQQEEAWNDVVLNLKHLDEEQKAREEEGDFEDFGGWQQEDYDTAMLVNYESRYWRNAARAT